MNNTTGVVTYQSNGAEVASDSFTYRVEDISGAVSNVATVNVTVTPVDDAPPGQASATVPNAPSDGPRVLVYDRSVVQLVVHHRHARAAQRLDRMHQGRVPAVRAGLL